MKLTSIMFAAAAVLATAAPAWADKAAGPPAGSWCNSGHWYGTSHLNSAGKWECLTTMAVNPNVNKGALVNPNLNKGAVAKTGQANAKAMPMP